MICMIVLGVISVDFTKLSSAFKRTGERGIQFVIFLRLFWTDSKTMVLGCYILK